MKVKVVGGFFYFLTMCLATGLDNRFGMADVYLWRKPEQLPVKKGVND